MLYIFSVWILNHILTSRRQTTMWRSQAHAFFLERLILTLRINDFVAPLNDTEVVYKLLLHHPRQFEHKLRTEKMESNVPKASWQETSRRDMYLQRASHRQGFVGRFLLCTMAALCQGMLPPPEPPVSKHPKRETQAILSIWRLTTPLRGSKFSLCVGSYEIMKPFYHHVWC